MKHTKILGKHTLGAQKINVHTRILLRIYVKNPQKSLTHCQGKVLWKI